MIKSLFDEPDPAPPVEAKPTSNDSRRGSLNIFDSEERPGDVVQSEEFVISKGESQSTAETIRQSGLAWSAGIAFTAAVVFMLILGWGADVLLGTSPWGIVGGIVLGSIIGFVQFFRVTSQIFKK